MECDVEYLRTLYFLDEKSFLERYKSYLKIDNPRKKEMLLMRTKGITFRNIGLYFGISGQRVQQIIGKAGKIKKYKAPKIKENLKSRVFNKIDIRGKDECWPFTGGLTLQKYGHINYNHKQFYAHRIAYEIFIGSFDNSLFVLHKCDNPPCCNPYHLFLGTQKDNMIDRDKKGHGNGK